MSEALNGSIVGDGLAQISKDERCSLPGTVSTAVEYYHSYMSDMGDFDEMFDFGNGVNLGVGWIELSNGSFYVDVDAGGDEAAMYFLIDASGRLVAHYQHNQSPDYALFCDGGESFRDDSECGIAYMDIMIHDASNEERDEKNVKVSDISSQLSGAVRLAALRYAAENSLSASKQLSLAFSTWDNDSAARVTVKTSGKPAMQYEVGSEPFGNWLFAAGEVGAPINYVCEEI